MHRLHTIRGTSLWCGPAAISALTGLSTDHAARMLGGEGPVSPETLFPVIRRIGLDIERHLCVARGAEAPTIGQVSDSCLINSGPNDPYLYLVVTPIHYMVQDRGYWACSIRRTPAQLAEGEEVRTWKLRAIWRMASTYL